MNIWFATTEYPPLVGGGISTYHIHTTRMLSRRGHNLTVFVFDDTISPNHIVQEETIEGVRIVRFALNQTPQSAALGEVARTSYDASEVVAAYIKREGVPDVLESQEYLGLPYFILQRRWLGEAGFDRMPVMVTAHTPLYICHHYDGGPQYRFPGWWIGEMERFSLRAADNVVFPSSALRCEIERDFPATADFSSLIANPYEDENIALVGLPPEERHGFLLTAKIERRKGIEPLLKTFEKLWNQGLEEPLILLGDDWYDELNQRLMSEVLKTRYHSFVDRGLLQWQGKQPTAVVRQVLKQVRAMILPSLFENYPYAVLEAMASGCPVIVSASGGHAEIVQDGSSGFVFSHSQPGDLEHKIQALLSMNWVEWQQMANAAQQRVKELSAYEVIAPQKEAALQETMERGKKKGQRQFPFLQEIPRRSGQPELQITRQSGLFSIVIPFYNMGEYLEDTLQSLSGLDNIPHEIIVVDDGSDDPSSKQQLEHLVKQYSIRLVHTVNQGLALARNTGANRAQGEFLAFLDADDSVDVEYYREALRVLRSIPDLSFVGCWEEHFGEDQGYWPTWNPEPPYALVHNPLATGALVYRRADFLQYGLNDPDFNQIMEDYDSLLSMLENGCKGVSIPQPYFKYRVRSKSMYHVSQTPIRQKAYEQLFKKHSSLYRQYAIEVMGLLNDNGPGYLYDNPTYHYEEVGYIQPATARVYFYFAFRALFLREYRLIRRIFPRIEVLQAKIKRLFIR